MRKNVIVLLAIIKIVESIRLPFNSKYTYDDYSSDFDFFSYEDDIEKVFLDANMVTLRRLAKAGHDVIINKYLILNPAELSYQGCYDSQNDVIGESMAPETLIKVDTFDWRTELKVSNVKQQRNKCGSCWAIAATSQYQSALAIKKGFLIDLSVQSILECMGQNSSCVNGSPSKALNLIIAQGMPTKSQYRASNSYFTYKSKPICNSTSVTKIKSDIIKVVVLNNITVDELQHQLVKNGPLSVAISKQLQFYCAGKSGIIKCQDSSLPLTHTVQLVGYNSTHWFIKNSWGRDWGDNGYGYIDKINDCGIRNKVTVLKLQTIKVQSTLDVIMSTEKIDWGGVVLTFKQNNIAFQSLGYNFISGLQYGPVSIKIDGNQYTDVLMTRIDTANSVDIKLSTQNKTLFQVFKISPSQGSNVIKTLCPLSGCPPEQNIFQYFLYKVSYSDDGWEDVYLGISVDKITTYITMRGKGIEGPFVFIAPKGANITIDVQILSRDSQNVSLYVLNQKKIKIFQRNAGKQLNKQGEILISWIAGSSN